MPVPSVAHTDKSRLWAIAWYTLNQAVKIFHQIFNLRPEMQIARVFIESFNYMRYSRLLLQGQQINDKGAPSQMWGQSVLDSWFEDSSVLVVWTYPLWVGRPGSVGLSSRPEMKNICINLAVQWRNMDPIHNVPCTSAPLHNYPVISNDISTFYNSPISLVTPHCLPCLPSNPHSSLISHETPKVSLETSMPSLPTL